MAHGSESSDEEPEYAQIGCCGPETVAEAIAARAARQEQTELVAYEPDGPRCRICHTGDTLGHLIRPCACTDLVHRECLDLWRTLSPPREGL